MQLFTDLFSFYFKKKKGEERKRQGKQGGGRTERSRIDSLLKRSQWPAEARRNSPSRLQEVARTQYLAITHYLRQYVPGRNWTTSRVVGFQVQCLFELIFQVAIQPLAGRAHLSLCLLGKDYDDVDVLVLKVSCVGG